MPTLREINVSQYPVKRGKVRDVYDLGERLLIIATDRISAFDCVLPDPIPQKGSVLTSLSEFWFDRFADRYQHHLIEVVQDKVPDGFEPVADQVRGRSMVCRKASVVPIECVARGYLAGSGWKEYQAQGTVCGIPLPPGLQQCSRLPEPIFTPSTKAEVGHDENISFEEACNQVGREVMTRLRDTTLALYAEASEYLRSRGIILADTKFEFGQADNELFLIDEVLTPDSSRFWPADQYEEGRDQDSFDKQFVRNHLQKLCDAGQWDKTDPAPRLPSDVVEATTARYLEAHERITGRPLAQA
ncbi:MAG: phosphoribosylaminoimidazolesuccinocarboxamide synthase [Phycisphaerales bacterium]|nr:phosphoribosylaminoimidazolesuccinocarboxamide synthase [Phycisphaerales bacterium]